MRFGSLFAGIGGFDLGFERAGMTCAWQVEYDPKSKLPLEEQFNQRILHKHWPDVPKYGDIRDVGKHNLKTVDLICGGFPCQPFSMQGKRGGFEQDNRFFEIIRIADELQTRWIVLENVQGFTKWRNEAQKEIENIGYEWIDFIFDARDFGIPQARRRWFAICFQRGNSINTQLLQRVQRIESKSLYGVCAYIENTKRGWTSTIQTKDEWRIICANSKRMRNNNGIPSRVDRLKSLGNAVVPQVAEFIGRMIMEVDNSF